MKPVQAKADALAVSLSVLCIAHCLFLPLVVISLPSVTSVFFADEAFHIWMVAAVIPVSALALYSGWKEHKELKVGLLGITGLMVLACAAFLGHDLLTESWERLLTVVGASVITVAHLWNYYLWKVEFIDDDEDTDSL